MLNHKKVSLKILCICRWTKQVLKLSGVDTVRFKAHSTRYAATSLADSQHIPMDTILKFAISSSPFARYYKLPIMADTENLFCYTVLTMYINPLVYLFPRQSWHQQDLSFPLQIMWQMRPLKSHLGHPILEWGRWSLIIKQTYQWCLIGTSSLTFRTSIVLIPTSCLSLPVCLVCHCDIHVKAWGQVTSRLSLPFCHGVDGAPIKHHR